MATTWGGAFHPCQAHHGDHHCSLSLPGATRRSCQDPEDGLSQPCCPAPSDCQVLAWLGHCRRAALPPSRLLKPCAPAMSLLAFTSYEDKKGVMCGLQPCACAAHWGGSAAAKARQQGCRADPGRCGALSAGRRGCRDLHCSVRDVCHHFGGGVPAAAVQVSVYVCLVAACGFLEVLQLVLLGSFACSVNAQRPCGASKQYAACRAWRSASSFCALSLWSRRASCRRGKPAQEHM